MTCDMVTQIFLFLSYLPLIDLKKWFVLTFIYRKYIISLSIPALWPFSYNISQNDLWCPAVAEYYAVSAVFLLIQCILSRLMLQFIIVIAVHLVAVDYSILVYGG